MRGDDLVVTASDHTTEHPKSTGTTSLVPWRPAVRPVHDGRPRFVKTSIRQNFEFSPTPAVVTLGRPTPTRASPEDPHSKVQGGLATQRFRTSRRSTGFLCCIPDPYRGITPPSDLRDLVTSLSR